MSRIAAVTLAIVLSMVLVAKPSPAQVRDASQIAQDFREQVNRGTVSIISGGINGTYIRIANDLAFVLDRGNELRVLPIIGKGSVQNITDILYLRGIDIGIVQSDVLTHVRSAGMHPTIERRIRYITKLYNEEFHLLAGPGINAIEDLAGRKVNFDIAGSGTYMTASIVFDTLGIDVEPVSHDQGLALELLAAGEIAGMVYVAGKPAQIFGALPTGSDVRLVPVPLTPDLMEIYLPSRFEHRDYPNLVPEGEGVETIAIGAVMAVYNWEPRHPRYERVATFVDSFFDNFEAFLQAPRHPKWQEVNLAAEVPGWTRFQPAQAWLDARPVEAAMVYDPELRRSFESFLTFIGQADGIADDTVLDEAARARLFDQFLRWREAGGAN
ncbi:MAG: TAXI family TRAP transporter solute-binding subunit [Rhodospirillales bacterium]|nr:MAG: TAXI family TRAP transporter solute-binding subunit [Rhodospirillales bacterium]